MSSSYLDDDAFVESVLEKGSIPFVVRGSISCLANFNFAPFVGVQISRPTYHLRVFGENLKEPDDIVKFHVRELVDEVAFPGEIELPSRNKEGISKALSALELWADFLCLAVGNPKVIVEIQRPINPIIAYQNEFDPSSLQRWASLCDKYFQLDANERKKLAGALWWYRKACTANYYSLFDGYTAYWNCLEILCGVAGNKINKGPSIDAQIQEYLKGKEIITAGNISEFYNRFVNYSIKEQMKDALKDMLGDDQAPQIIYQCFEISPEKDRLYQIRNDINHGNIRENSGIDYHRVHSRGALLLHIVMTLIHQRLGHPISIGKSVNELAEQIQNEGY